MKEVKREFQVGDKVRIIGRDYFYNNNVGKVGVVEEVDKEDSMLNILVNFGSDEDYDKDWGNTCEIELVESVGPTLEDRVKTLEQTVQALQSQLSNSDNELATTIGVFSCGFLEEGKIYPVDSKPLKSPVYKNPHPRFAHIRNKYEDNGYRLNYNKGGVTIAYQELADGFFNIGIALCSANDNFDRSVGRKIATDRLKGKPYNVSEDTLRRFISVTSVGEFMDSFTWAHGKAEYINDRLVEACYYYNCDVNTDLFW